jgi:uncharacterized membrane protein YphA (DoxX/SURF4 family)
MLNRRPLSDVGIHVFGCAAIALGLIELAWGEFATVWHPVPPGFPLRTALVYVVAVCFIGVGIAMQLRRTAGIGLLGAATLYLLAALLWVRRVVHFPMLIGTWLGFAEQFALVAAAVMWYTLMTPSDGAWRGRPYHLSRGAFGLCAITFGLAHFLAVGPTAKMVPAWIPPSQHFWAIATGVAHLLAGLAILSGIRALLAARLLTLMLVGFGVLIWIPRLVNAPHEHISWAGNAVNLAAVGAAWLVADSIARARTAVPRSTSPDSDRR